MRRTLVIELFISFGLNFITRLSINIDFHPHQSFFDFNERESFQQKDDPNETKILDELGIELPSNAKHSENMPETRPKQTKNLSLFILLLENGLID